MSLALLPAQVAKVIDPICDLNRPHFYTALKGGSVVSYTAFPALNYSANNAVLQCNPPDEFTIVDKKPLQRFAVTLNFVGTSTSGNLLQLGTNDGLSFAPIQKLLSTHTVNLNNDTLTMGNNNEIAPILLRCNNDLLKRDNFDSMSALQPDQFQDYNDWVTQGSARNPLAFYGENSAEQSRGGFPVVVNSNTPTAASVSFTVTEPIIVSPFDGYSCHQTAGLTGIRNIRHNMTFTDLSLMWAHSAVGGNHFTSVSGTIDGIDIIYKYITPDPTMRVPDNYNCAHYELVPYDTVFNQSLSAGVPRLLTGANSQLTAIPRRLYVWAGQPMSTKQAPFALDVSSNQTGGILYPDAYCKINQVTVLFNNTQYLATAQPQDLWRMSVKNGLNMSYSQFSQFCGSILVIDMGLDIGLHADQSAGLAGNFQIQVQANVTNLSPNAFAPTLYVWASYEGQVNVLGGNITHQLGVLNKSDVLNAQKVDGVNFKSERHVYGGSFWGDVWSGIKKAANWVKDNKLISRATGAIGDPRAQAISRAASAIGLGNAVGGDYVGGALVEGGRMRKRGGKKRKSKKGGAKSSMKKMESMFKKAMKMKASGGKKKLRKQRKSRK